MALMKSNFFIWHQVEISFPIWHYHPFAPLTESSGCQNDTYAPLCIKSLWCQIGKAQIGMLLNKENISIKNILVN